MDKNVTFLANLAMNAIKGEIDRKRAEDVKRTESETRYQAGHNHSQTAPKDTDVLKSFFGEVIKVVATPSPTNMQTAQDIIKDLEKKFKSRHEESNVSADNVRSTSSVEENLHIIHTIPTGFLEEGTMMAYQKYVEADGFETQYFESKLDGNLGFDVYFEEGLLARVSGLYGQHFMNLQFKPQLNERENRELSEMNQKMEELKQKVTRCLEVEDADLESITLEFRETKNKRNQLSAQIKYRELLSNKLLNALNGNP